LEAQLKEDAMSGKVLRILWSAALLAVASSAQSPWLVPYGDAGCASGFVPTLHTGGEMPTLGNANFKLTSENLRGGAPGFISLSNSAVDLPFLGMRLYIDPRLGLAIGSHATGMSAVPGSGVANISLPIPSDASLVGGKFFLQGLFIDSAFPFSLVTTQGLGITIAQSIAVERMVIRDRLKYQAHFAGATQAQADTLGRAIWAGNQVAGYSYVKTEQFTCGGESHWMVIVLHASTGLEFTLIPGGSYRMGDIYGTGWKGERPVHYVRIAPFLLARTEVTQGSYIQVLGLAPWLYQPYTMLGSDYAASYVNLADSRAYCALAGLRLPSEAEWEYACRAGVDTCFNFGEKSPPTSLESHAWYQKNCNATRQTYAHLVGTKPPNAFGLHDMHGNVREWCEDPFLDFYKCAPIDGGVRVVQNPVFSITRGGGWRDDQVLCRVSLRQKDNNGLVDYGFRPAGPRL